MNQTQGISNKDAFRREQIMEMGASQSLRKVRAYDQWDLNEIPFDPEIIAQLNPTFDRSIENADGYPELQAQGRELRERLKTISFGGATAVIIIGRKYTKFGESFD